MSRVIAPLVGDHFHPPASLVLKHLPTGSRLQLEPDPGNPYDEFAVKVLVDPGEIPESQFGALGNFEFGLPSMGLTLEQLQSSGPIWLGHLAASGGKPLAKALAAEPGLVGNREVLDLMKDPDHRAELAFAPDGKPRVVVSIPEYPEATE